MRLYDQALEYCFTAGSSKQEILNFAGDMEQQVYKDEIDKNQKMPRPAFVKNQKFFLLAKLVVDCNMIFKQKQSLAEFAGAPPYDEGLPPPQKYLSAATPAILSNPGRVRG